MSQTELLAPPPRPARPLRPYQQAGVEAIFDSWTRCKRVLIVMATGTGKTRVAGEVLLRRRPAGRSLWLVHRTVLVEQAAESLRGDGLTVEIEQADQRATVVSMRPSDVVVASVQSMVRDRRLDIWRKHPFATIVIDEAHRSASASYHKILDAFPDALVLGPTATPDRADGVGLATVYDEAPFAFGIREGIAAGALCPIRARLMHCDKLSLEDVDMRGSDYDPDALADLFARADYAALHEVAGSLLAERGTRPTVVFLPRVDTARAMSVILTTRADGLPAHAVASIDGETPPAERARIFREYERGQIQVLTSCDVLTEGWDAPWTSCIAIAAPTKSRSRYAQRAGRGTRIYPGKQDLLLLDYTDGSVSDLVGPEDLLGEDEDLSPAAKKAVREAMASSAGGLSLEEILAKCEEDAAAREKKLRLERLRGRLRVAARYCTSELNVLGAGERHVKLIEDAATAIRSYSHTRGAPIATDKQRDWCARFGIQLPKTATIKQASAAIDVMQKAGVCSLRQAKVLARAGLPADVSAGQARVWLDALAKNGWQVTDAIRGMREAGR